MKLDPVRSEALQVGIIIGIGFRRWGRGFSWLGWFPSLSGAEFAGLVAERELSSGEAGFVKRLGAVGTINEVRHVGAMKNCLVCARCRKPGSFSIIKNTN